MASVITNDWRRFSLDLLKDDLQSGGSNYYVGFARADSANSITEPNSVYSQLQVRNTLQSVKTLSNVSFVVPTVQWSSGEVYQAYTDKNFDQVEFYVVNPDTNEVFLCVEQSVDDLGNVQQTLAGAAPTSTLANNSAKTFKTPDGYKWRFLYKISNLAYATYRSTAFIPVKHITNVSFIPEEEQQLVLQDSSVAGEIIGIEVVDGGSAYTSAPTVSILGNGSGASYTATVSNGSVVRVQVDSNGSGIFSHGSGYDYASVNVSTGNAVLKPVIGPRQGVNNDPVTTLKARSLMFQVDVQADENNTILAENDFTQVVLMKGLKNYGSDSDFTGNTGNALRSFDYTLTSGSAFLEDEIITGSTSSASAKVFYQDGSKLYFYQDEETGFGTFSVPETVQGSIGSPVSQISVSAINNPDFDPYSGELLYINNITAIDRAANQTEDIRIIIQLG